MIPLEKLLSYVCPTLFITKYGINLGFAGGSDGKESTCNVGDLGLIPGLGRSLEEGMATHSSILVRRIPMAKEPGVLQSVGPQRVEHD